MNNASHQPNEKIAAGIGIFLITLIIVGVIVVTAHDTPMVADTTTTMQPASPQQPTHAYKNGTYTESGSYSSPAGRESIGVTLTLSSGMISDATVVRQATDQTASSYQGIFIGGYKSLVVGKPIDSVSLSNVAGSSLTPKGFMDALSKIKTDAGA